MAGQSMTDIDIQLEMAYTTYEDSCRDPALVDGALRECRRPRWHTPHQHAAGATVLCRWGAWRYADRTTDQENRPND